VIEILRKLKSAEDANWARYKALRVAFVMAFLVFITVTSTYMVYALYQAGLIHFFSIAFILLILGIQRGVFRRMMKAIRKKQLAHII